MENSSEKGEKITKILASCGYGSRRSCEELIDLLRVTINGRVAERGDRAKTGDEVRIDNSKVRKPVSLYFKVYKPKGYLCNDTPAKGVPQVNDLMPKTKSRLYVVGRLDKDFEGLMIFTNDGEICNRLTHPRYQCPKKYEVRIKGSVSNDVLDKITKGIYLSEGKTAPIEIQVKKMSPERTIVIMEINENRRRLIPRVFAHFDYHVDKVKRVSVGPVKLTGMSAGEVKRLTPQEIEILQAAALKKVLPAKFKKKTARFNPRFKTKKKTNQHNTKNAGKKPNKSRTKTKAKRKR